jgi:predicted dehydrogenase
MDRRQFLLSSAAAAASAQVGTQGRRTRMALVGTGERGIETWGRPVASDYADVVEIVALCDINGLRAKAAQGLIGTKAPVYVDFERMISETAPELVVISTVDAAHCRYVLRALELGLKVMCEKPMCTDEAQVQAVVDAVKKSRGELAVAFVMRHYPAAMRIKQLLMNRAIGSIVSVDFNEYLDTSHGASYFRRWHNLKENSGTLLCTKASHHFDLVNWWLASDPLEVAADGDLRVYGKNGAFRSAHCRGCPYKQQCRFYWDVMGNPFYVKLYVECESEDGYFRDGCLYRENTNIYDTMSVQARYENGVRLNYLANAYLPYEGQAIAIDGDRGRIEWNNYSGGGFKISELRLTRTFGKSEVIPLPPEQSGGHGGTDSAMRDLIFRKRQAEDPLDLRAGVHAGAASSLLGIAAYRSIERGGERIKISSLRRS